MSGRVRVETVFGSWAAYGRREERAPATDVPVQIDPRGLVPLSPAERFPSGWPAIGAVADLAQSYLDRLVASGLVPPGDITLEAMTGMPVEGAADAAHRIVLIDQTRLEQMPALIAHDLVLHELLHLGHRRTSIVRGGVAFGEMTTSALAAAGLLRMVPDLATYGPGHARPERLAYWERTYAHTFLASALQVYGTHQGITGPMLPMLLDLHRASPRYPSALVRALEADIYPLASAPIDMIARRLRDHHGAQAECLTQLHRFCGHTPGDRLVLALGLAYSTSYAERVALPGWASRVMDALAPDLTDPDTLADRFALDLVALFDAA